MIQFNGCYELWQSVYFVVGYPNGQSTQLSFRNPTSDSLMAVYIFHGEDGTNIPVLDYATDLGSWAIAGSTTTELPTKSGQTRTDELVAKAANFTSTTPAAGTFFGSIDVLVQVSGTINNTNTSLLDQVVVAQNSGTMDSAPLWSTITNANGQQIYMSNPVLYRSIIPGADRVIHVSLPNPPAQYRRGWSERLDASKRIVSYVGPQYVVKNLGVDSINPDVERVWLTDESDNVICTAGDLVINPGAMAVGAVIGELFPESCFRHQNNGFRAAWVGHIHFKPVFSTGLFLPAVISLSSTNEQ